VRPEIKRWILPAILLVVTVLVTALIRVPVPLETTVGSRDAGVYVTLGDACIFLAVLVCGGPWGALIAALGMGLADLFVGSYSYIIGTVIIKAGMAFFIAAFGPKCKEWKQCFRMAFAAEVIMILGYFVYDLVVFGQYVIAAYEIPLNIAQGLVCGALGAVILKLMPQKLRGIGNPTAKRIAPEFVDFPESRVH